MAVADDDTGQELATVVGRLGVANGGSGADLSASGPGYWYQASVGAAATVRDLGVITHGGFRDLKLDFLAIGDGVTNDAAAIQNALNWLRDSGGTLYVPYATYKCNSALTLLRAESGDSTAWTILGNNATFDFTSLTGSTTALTVGATSTSFFAEMGSIRMFGLKLLGPEANGAGGGSTNTTTTTGVLFEFAGRVYLENVQVPNWYNAIRTRFAFPFTAVNTQARNSYIGVWHDEVSNLQRWINTGCNQCRYGVLLKATTTNLDSGKMNNIAHDSLHLEGTRVGVHIDPGSTDTTVKIEQVRIIAPYAANSTYDSIRAGMEWTFGTPQTRGADATNFTVDLRVEDGFWNLTPDADTAAIAFGSNGKTRHVFVDIPVPPLEDNANTIAGTPGGGSRIILRPRASGTGKHTEYIYNDTPARSVRRQSTGRTLIGAAKTTTGNIATVGIELEENGVIWSTASANPVLRLNRTTSDGTLVVLGREGVTVGSIDVTAAGASFGGMLIVGGVPTFSDFTNAQHDHDDANDGGKLPASAIGSGQIAAARGGTGLDTSGSTGTPTLAAGTWSVNAETGTGSHVRATAPALTNPTATLGSGSASVKIDGTYATFTSATGVGNGADATDDALWTLTAIPANTFTANGDTLLLTLGMKTGATANNKRVGVTVGGTQVNTNNTSANNVTFGAVIMITRVSATAVNVFIMCSGGVGAYGSSINMAVADLTANTLAIVVTGASPTSSAANDVVLYSGIARITK